MTGLTFGLKLGLKLGLTPSIPSLRHAPSP